MSSEVRTAPISIAFVSGKGGSGKTMIAAVAARIVDRAGRPVVLVDADVATGGLTYYLGLKRLRNTGRGLSTIAQPVLEQLSGDTPPARSQEAISRLVHEAVQPILGWEEAEFLGIGDHRRLYRLVEKSPNLFGPLASVVVQTLELDTARGVMVDCRGGIDNDSIEVCRATEDIVLIVETDTTSIQATQHLVDVLSDNDLAQKLRGFIINKAFDDPSYLAQFGTSAFRCQFLGAVPFDLEATRSFLLGEIPARGSLFVINLWEALHKAYPEYVPRAEGRPLTAREFRELGLTDPDSSRGGLLAAGGTLLFGLLTGFLLLSGQFYTQRIVWISALIYVVIFGMLGSLESSRRVLGRLIGAYVRLLRRIGRPSQKT